MATQSSISTERHVLADTTHKHFFEFGEGMMHPVDTVKTRIQSQAILSASQILVHTRKGRALDVIKTRLQVQGSTLRYKGWLDAIRSVWRAEGAAGMFRGSIPRITWDIPASALTFMAVEFLREHFNEGLSNENTREVASMPGEKKRSPLQGAA